MSLAHQVRKKEFNLFIIGLTAVVSCLFYSTLSPLIDRWTKTDQDLSHGIPTLALFVFFIWRASPVQQTQDPRSTSWILCAGLALLSFCWYLFQSINIELPAALLLILILTTYIAACFSLRTAIDLLPIIGLLLFVVPIFSELNNQLVNLSSFVVGKLVEAVKLTAVIEGNNILIPSGRITIAEGCSGLRYLTITVLLAYVVCLLNGYSLRQKIIALFFAIILGLLTNWIRIFSLVLIGYHSEMQSGLMQDHEMFGWILFVIIIMPAIYWAPIVHKNTHFLVRAAPRKLLVPTVLLALGPALLYSVLHAKFTDKKFDLNGIASQYATTTDTSGSWVNINFPVSTEKTQRHLKIEEIIVQVDLATFTPKKPSDKLVPYTQSLYSTEDWVSTIQPKASAIDGFELVVLKNVESSEKFLFMYQFNVGSSATGSYRLAKLMQIKAKLLGENYFGLITLQSMCAADCTLEAAAFKKVAADWKSSKFIGTAGVPND